MTWLVGTSVDAQQGGFYYGAAATLQDAETAVNRTIDSAVEHVDVPDTQFATSNTAMDNSLQWDALAGYRFNMAEGTQFLALQAEISLIGDDVNRIPDNSEPTPGQKLFGESWAQNWEIETSRSIGIIAKYGFNRQFLNVFDLSAYGLVGVRQTKLDFFSSFLGCYQTAGCSVDELRSESTQIEPEMNMYVTGVGLETHLGLKTAFQIEVRVVGEASSNWNDAVQEGDDMLVAPTMLEQSGTDVSMKLIRYL